MARSGLLLLVVLLSAGPATAGENPAPAGTAEVDGVLEQMQSAYAAVPGVQAQFTQTLTGFSFMEPVRRSGTIALQKPGRMAMVFEGDRPMEYRTDGERLWLLDGTAKTATVFKTAAAQVTRLYDFLTGAANVREDFRVTLGSVDEGSLLVLEPKVEDANMARIELHVDASGFVRGLVWDTAMGDRTRTKLEELKTASALPDSSFVWTAQPGWSETAGD